MVEIPPYADPPNDRWKMLAIASMAQLAMTLNWFNISPALPDVAGRLGFGVEGQSAAVSAFVVAFALLHIPGGMLGARIGIKRTLVLGSLAQAAGAAATGLAPNLATLLVARFVCGAGASVITVVAVGAMSAWFHKRETALALSVITGVAFTGGIAIAFYGWTHVQQSLGLVTSFLVSAAVLILSAGIIQRFFRTPVGHTGLEGTERLDMSAVRAACRNRQVLVYGLAFMGTYGAYITVSQLLVPYAVDERGFGIQAAGLLAGIIAVVGIPVSLVGGWLADRTGRVRALIGLGTALTAGSTFLIPSGPRPLLWLGGIGVTVFLLLAFPVWAAVPAQVAQVPLSMVGAASGVMFTLSGIGGFVMPLLYGAIAARSGYSAAWVALAAISAVFALLGILGRNSHAATTAASPAAAPAAPLSTDKDLS